MRYLLPFLVSLVASLVVKGQKTSYTFDYLTTEDGLSNNIVRCILQDREGFMWFGTSDGLNKYDGHTFRVFKPDPADPENSLRGAEVWDIHEDRAGRLWVATYEGGLQQVDKRTGKIRSYTIDARKASRWDELFTISEDRKGNLWLGTEKGLVRFDPETQRFRKYSSPRLIHTEAMAMFQEDTLGNFWATNIDGVFRFDPQTGKYTVFQLDSYPPDQRPIIWGLHLDKAGTAWVVTDGAGLFRMDTHTGRFSLLYPEKIHDKINPLGIYETGGEIWLSTTEGLQCISKKTSRITTYRSDPSTPGSLNSNDVRSVYRDRSGNLWVGTGHGINKSVATRKPFFVHQVVPAPKPFYKAENLINEVLEDQRGDIWIGSAYNQVIHYAGSDTRKNIDQKSLLQVKKKLKEDVNTFIASRSGQIWLASSSSQVLKSIDPTTGRVSSYPCQIPVRDLAEDPSGRIWMGGWTLGVACFDPRSKQFTYYKPSRDSSGLLPASVQDIVASRTGEIWIATYAGISRLDPRTGTFRNYVQKSGTSVGFLNDYKVMVLFEDQKGLIWAGTNQGGLNCLDPATDTFTYYTTRDGLPSNHIRSLAGDAKGTLWIGTNRGLSRFDPRAKTFRNFDISDGLPDNEFLHGSAYSSRRRLLFGTRNGFTIFYPDSIESSSAKTPVYLTGLKVLGKDRELPAGRMELAYDQNALSFDFVAINYASPGMSQYAYRLAGLDQEWIHSGTRRFASYTNLDPGEYVFKVKAKSREGGWGEQIASLPFVILPPWWQTWWAYGLYGMLIVGLLLGLRQYTINRERLKNDLILQRHEAEKMHELDQLKSRFFANISHELRTPLTLLLSPLETLIAQEPKEGKNRQLLQLMLRNARRLLNLINQLLDLAKLEAGRLQLQTVALPIVPHLKGVVLGFTSLAERTTIHFTASFPDRSPIVVFDADKLDKIVINLLSNAFKFTPGGGVVKVSVSLSDAPTAMPGRRIVLEIKVTDTGIGIAEEEREKVFDRFYQVDHAHTNEKEGTGIGLALTKELVELHGGTIELASTPGLGSTFMVRIPLDVAEESVVVERQEPEGQEEIYSAIGEEEAMDPTGNGLAVAPKSKAPVILLADDNADVRYFIREQIGAAYRLIEATNGVEALAMATQYVPDLIISDIMMPQLDGVTFCQRVKADLRTSHIPVILLTARAGEESKLEGLGTGADDYLIKPFQVEELKVRVSNLIKQRRLLRDRFSKHITLEPQAVVTASVDEKFLQKVLTLIEDNMANPDFDVDLFGREMGMSRIHLHRKLKALTDQSPGDLVRTMRLKKAASLLEQNSGNISEIAFGVGFSSLTYFTRCFRKEFGVSPTEYLQRLP